ncbi:hypothetical protein Tco_0788308 [Tanacetum coccineum]
MVESTFSMSTRQMALWKSQMEEHTSDWLRVVLISRLGQTINGRAYRCVLCYRLGVPLFTVPKPCSACSRVFIGDIYGDHVVSCTSIIGIKYRHNIVHDTLLDICFQSRISVCKEVDIGLGVGREKPLRPADMLLYSWDGWFDICVDLTGEYIARTPLTPLVKPGCGIHLIAVGTVWRRLVSKVSAVLIGHSLDVYFDDLQFGVRVSGGGEAILHVMNRLIEGHGDDVGLSMLWNFVTLPQLDCITGNTPYGHAKGCSKAWYLDDGTIIGDTLVVGKVLELIMEDGPRCGLHLNVDKTKVFLPKEGPRSRLAGVFPPNIARPLHGVKLLGGSASVDFNFSTELVMKRVTKTIELMGIISNINDPQCELMLLRACAGISKLYFAMRTCFPWVFEMAQRALMRLFVLPLSVLSLLLGLTKLLRHSSIVASGPAFNDALCAFNTKMETDLLSNASEIAAPKLMKKLADIYFTRVTQTAESTFSLSSRQMALWQSQLEDHTSDSLRTVSIFGLGQNMNGKTYSCVLYYRRDIYGDHAVSCVGIIGIKHRHNVVRDTLVDICFRSGISAGKEVDIGLGGGCDKPLRPVDMLLYSWDEGLDLCVDLTGSSPLTQTGMVDFVPGHAVTEVAHRKRVKYEAKCANIGYGFLPFSFSSLEELEKDAVNLLKRIQKFFVTQDIGARAVVHIFNRISFAITKGLGAQLTMRYRVLALLVLNIAIMLCAIPLSTSAIGRGFQLLNEWGPDSISASHFFCKYLDLFDAAQHKRGKYMDRCAAIRYGFLPFSFSSLGELRAYAVNLLKRIRKFSITQDIGARAAIYIFNRIGFAIAKGGMLMQYFGWAGLDDSPWAVRRLPEP